MEETTGDFFVSVEPYLLKLLNNVDDYCFDFIEKIFLLLDIIGIYDNKWISYPILTLVNLKDLF